MKEELKLYEREHLTDGVWTREDLTYKEFPFLLGRKEVKMGWKWGSGS